MPSTENAFEIVKNCIPNAINKMNQFCQEVLKTRGGRIGSGMGGLLEALWGYYMNTELSTTECEIAWFPNHQYHDFACLHKTADWNEETKAGEFFRIEAKTMNTGADESKGHFDVLKNELEEYDSLIILTWEWKSISVTYNTPYITDYFFGKSIPITQIRDELHIARGGSFVDPNNCPDHCIPADCTHSGEPLNEQGKRERLSGPDSCRPSQKVSYAANFGGLVRMLKTNNSESRSKFRELRRDNRIVDEYVSFIHRNSKLHFSQMSNLLESISCLSLYFSQVCNLFKRAFSNSLCPILIDIGNVESLPLILVISIILI